MHLPFNSYVSPIFLPFPIGLELEQNWRWIGVATLLHRKRSDIKAWCSRVCNADMRAYFLLKLLKLLKLLHILAHSRNIFFPQKTKDFNYFNNFN